MRSEPYASLSTWPVVCLGVTLVFALMDSLGESGAQAATYRVGLAEDGYVPFSYPKPKKKADQGKRRGIFLEILSRIGSRTGDSFVPVFAPTPRLSRLFEKGQIDIEPGMNPSWRGEQRKISLYSAAFAEIVDVILYRNGKLANDPEKLFHGPVGTVRGYKYPLFGDDFRSGRLKREDADSEESLVKMLAKGRVKQIFIGEIVARYHMKDFEHHDFAIGPEIGRVPISYRVHVSKKDLVPKLNQGILEMKRRGEIKTLLRGGRLP